MSEYSMTFSDYEGTIQAMRSALKKDIMEVFSRHPNRTETNYWSEVGCNSTPVICDSDVDDGVYTLNRLVIIDGKIGFEASNSYEWTTFSWVSLETLLEIRNELIDYEDVLFEDLDEE